MSNPFADQIAQTMEAMRDQLAKAEETQAELEKLTASVTSKDRLVTVKVGPQGQVLALTFHTTGYRDKAPAELGALLTDLLNEARAKVGEQVAARIREFEGIGDTLRLSMTGGSDLDDLLEPLWAMRPGYADDVEKKKTRKQEEFGG
ncbi:MULTISPECIES: YbaB/EbfC family nucleoid-associated protein [unclassified Streptomyces]|uniref:YbaB/EbfC family nucleoid-associated protein n=1 Tax=Streptomycetaceae TaxID=2062 RepID=UPI002E79A758|nr:MULTISPECIES: YbaB/EbfC family nucleoid-associated protein [unclassified Streptomyces]MED7955017.1 YbaB/EbfC family nucleoid-associated protein [Streptomyces sp. BE303]MEE1828026.1 YbaB/EbfC family nucleoid-associated protein [Streptomyces sp. BE20]